MDCSSAASTRDRRCLARTNALARRSVGDRSLAIARRIARSVRSTSCRATRTGRPTSRADRFNTPYGREAPTANQSSSRAAAFPPPPLPLARAGVDGGGERGGERLRACRARLPCERRQEEPALQGGHVRAERGRRCPPGARDAARDGAIARSPRPPAPHLPRRLVGFL